MKRWIKNQWRNLKLAWFSLFYGMKSADDIVVGAKTDHTGEGLTIDKVMEVDNIFSDLLKGEVTERVVETRHSLYAVHQHSIDMEKKEKRTKKNEINEAFLPRHCLLVEGEYYPVKLIQENYSWCEEPDDPPQYLLKIERDFMPRLKIEEITNKISIKEYNENFDEIDFYCRNYVRKYYSNDNFYVSELKKISHGLFKSELLEFNRLSFNTEKPFGMDEGVLVKYNDFQFQECIEFDGHFILRFIARPDGTVEKLVDKYKSETMAEKYEKKATRDDGPQYQLTSWDVIEKQESGIGDNTDEALNLLENLKSETLSIKKSPNS